MKRYLILIPTILLIIIASSCRNDFEFEDSTGDLIFSQDTVFLDTVFSIIGSSTRQFKVYNRSSDDIVIPRVALAQGDNSNYRLAVDGVPGKVFENVELLAQDSLFIFVETTVDINTLTTANQFLYEDTIEFDSGANLQTVQLVTLIQDAILLFPERNAQGVVESLPIGMDADGNEIRIEGFVLDDNELNFTNDKPYVIYGFAAVGANKTLSIDAGARVHFHADSGIIVGNEGSLQVNGSPSTTDELENEVIFEGDRLEPDFAEVPGQWFGIFLTDGSRDHIFNNATIKNASIGIIMDNANPASNGATLQINNTQIYNCSNSGIIGTTANIAAENLVINNTGQSALVARLGGDYSFNNCTIANYWDNGFRQDPTLFISNTIPNSGLSEPLVQATFTNCIIYGDRNIELALLDDDVTTFNFGFSNSVIRFNDRFDDFNGIPAYDFMNTNLYDTIILNEEPLFEDPDLNLLAIDDLSPANALADPATAATIDIENNPRAAAPDAGAYESRDLED